MLGEKFTVTEDHIKLLREMYVSWNSMEYGAPTIDPKRPYGDSDVHGSMIRALGIDVPDYSDFGDIPENIEKKITKLHQEMEKVLQIFIDNLGIKPEKYVYEYSNGWKESE